MKKKPTSIAAKIVWKVRFNNKTEAEFIPILHDVLSFSSQSFSMNDVAYTLAMLA